MPDARLVARSINERGKVRAGTDDAAAAPKPKALRPSLFNNRLELSTYCIDGLEREEQWVLLEKNCGEVYALTELLKEFVIQNGLALDCNWEPEFHVDVVDWPDLEHARDALTLAMAKQLRAHLKAP